MSKLSLLWPEGEPARTWPISAEVIRDLELEAVVGALCPHGPYRVLVSAIATQLCLDADTIRYRQEVLSDLQRQPQLAAALRALLPLLDELALFSHRLMGNDTRLHEVVARATELELLIEAVNQLQQAFSSIKAPLKSAALLGLKQRTESIAASSDFQQLATNLPRQLEKLRTSASITIGVNLDHALRPEEAILLAVNDFRYSESSLLDRLLGKGAGEGKGIARLHTPPLISEGGNLITGGLSAQGPPKRMDPLLVPLFRDLANILDQVAQPIADELRSYAQLNSDFLLNLRSDIIFYVYSLAMIEELAQAGMPWCWPTIAPADERICQVEDAYNLQLAIRDMNQRSGPPLATHIVKNDVKLGENGRIAILTGPNQGGKTTYMQSVGLLQVLAQLGLPVPGTAARISPVDAIYSHYPVEEQLDLGTGRFGDEAQRMRTIFEHVTRHSLVLLNESLATTNAGESIFLAQDIVRVLRQIGCRVIFTTHLHDLAAAAGRINQDTAGDSKVISLVASAQVEETDQKDGYSYLVSEGPPLGRSYAESIAARYGIGYGQLEALLEKRGL